MFVIAEAKGLKDYDLFLEEFAYNLKDKDLYPRCSGEFIIPFHKVPNRIRDLIQRHDILRATVRWQYDLNENKEIIGKIEFVFNERGWFSIEGNLEDWKKTMA